MPRRTKPDQPVAVCMVLCDDHAFVETSLRSFASAGPMFAFVSRLAWDGSPGDWERAAEAARRGGAEVIVGDWPTESTHRSHSIRYLREKGFKFVCIPDGDEVVEPKLLKALLGIAEKDLADMVRVRLDTFWRDACHAIRPREELAPILMLNCQVSDHLHIREYSGERAITLGPEHGLLLHLSYAGDDNRILRKISTWGHKHEVAQEWFQKVWKGWEADPTIRQLHPTHPACYGSIEAVQPHPLLAHLPRWRDETVEKPERWPTVSVVIPLHGGSDDIRLCLQSLGKIKDLLYETIVVDDASPDDAPQVAASFDFVKLVKSETNEGFAAACNKGLKASSGEVVLFLNSDTVAPRSGLIRLIEALGESMSIGAAGPMTNNAGYYQKLDPTYTSPENLDAFSDDLALSARENKDVEMLVGFALAVKRTVLDEIGGFDTRFGLGMFDETDLCYRIQRAGMRLRLASRAYIHHAGSKTLQRVVPDMPALLRKNEAVYRAKWQWDLDIGYASHLPGLDVTSGQVTFDQTRHPDRIEHYLAKKRKKANISLTMIARNEEKSIGACLKSARHFFSEIIVVDTGSTDRTMDICRGHGAKVFEMVWPDSFAEARNEAMKHATGEWICWIDADDTLPFATGMALLEAAISGGAQAFIVPVQFLDNGVPRGTSVDHIKLFRNLDGLKWTRRIHEQILSSLTARGILPARLDVCVLHSHYDNSADGQKRKLERDRRLLAMELADEPNDPFTLFNLGMTENHAGNHELATGYLMRALENATPQMTHTRKIYALLGQSLRDSGEPEKALAMLEAGLTHYPDDPELHFNAAVILKEAGKLAPARDHLRLYGEDISGHFSSLDKGILTYKRWVLLGDLSAELGDHQEAVKWYRHSMDREPWFANAPAGLVDSALKVGDLGHARFGLDALLKTLGPCRDWAEREAKYAEMVGGPDNVLPVLFNLAERLPGAAQVCLTLSRALLARNRIGEAISHLEAMERGGVAEAAFEMSHVFERCNDPIRARFYAFRAAELDPDNPLVKERIAGLQIPVDQLPPPEDPDLDIRVRVMGPEMGKMGAPTKRHSVVIVTYESAKWIESCLASVLPTLSPEDEVIVIDNASADDTVARIKKLGVANIAVIRNRTNRGYAPAADQGIKKSKGEFIVLLNPDTEVHPNWLTSMAACLEVGVGAVGPVSDAISGDQFVGNYVPAGVANGSGALGDLVSSRYKDQALETKFLVGMCLMLPRKVLNEVGLLDDAMELGADDLDLSWRMRCLGFSLKVALSAFVHHAEHSSFEARPKDETAALVAKSDAVLVGKLKEIYGANIPTSHTLWGCDIFDEALRRGSAA